MRFRVAAAMAKQLSCDAFTSTLLVSPYQKHDLIREVGERVARETGLPFYYVDFRPGWRLRAHHRWSRDYWSERQGRRHQGLIDWAGGQQAAGNLTPGD